MALTPLVKKTYVYGIDPVSSSNLNAIQDAVIQMQNNYTDPDLSLKKIADIYAYTDKYLSHLFKAKMNINWNTYINRLRIQHAIKLIGDGSVNLSDIAAACGYRDVMYFSKVFKKFVQW